MPGVKDPTVHELKTFYDVVTAQIKANANTTTFTETANASQAAMMAKMNLCFEALSLDKNDKTYLMGRNDLEHVPALDSCSPATLMTVAQAETLLAYVFYGGDKSKVGPTDLADLATAVKNFKTAWKDSCDPSAGTPQGQAGLTGGAINGVRMMNGFVASLDRWTMRTSTTPVVVTDNAGTRVDTTFGAKAFCDLVADTLQPFLNNNAQPATELNRQRIVSTHPLTAFANIIDAAAAADTTTPSGQPIIVDPVGFMEDHFDPSTDQDTTRSDIFSGLDGL